MGQTPAVVLCFALLVTACPAAPLSGRTQPDVTPEAAAEAASLVRQLGDPQFSRRKRAMGRIIDLGVDAIAALEEGVHSADREISFRSRHALEIVREHDFQRRLRAFAVGLDENESYQLPGWALFRKEAGDNAKARSLFVEMQQAEPQLLRAIDRSMDEAIDAFLTRLAEIQERARQGGKSDQLSLGSVTTFLFILNQVPGGTTGLSELNFGSHFSQESFSAALQTGSYRDILRRMLGKWIEESQGWDAFYAVILAMQHDMPQGLIPAKRILQSEASDPNRVYTRGYALQAFAKFGDESHFPLIEPLLEDATPYTGLGSVSGKAKFRLQIRDIALATLVHLAKQDPKHFGLARLKLMGSTQVFNTNSIAFEDDAKRDEAIKKWKAFRANSS